MNVGHPLPDPRLAVIHTLSAQIDSFFAAGNRVQHIPSGVSSDSAGVMASHQQKLRAERDKLAPTATYLSGQGMTMHDAAVAMGIATKRLKLIAKEHSLTFAKS